VSRVVKGIIAGDVSISGYIRSRSTTSPTFGPALRGGGASPPIEGKTKCHSTTVHSDLACNLSPLPFGIRTHQARPVNDIAPGMMKHSCSRVEQCEKSHGPSKATVLDGTPLGAIREVICPIAWCCSPVLEADCMHVHTYMV
jgi:hypothetical protein